MKRRTHLIALTLLALLVLFAVLSLRGEQKTAAAARQPAQQPAAPCPFVPIDPVKYGNKPFQNPPEIRSTQGRLQTTLAVKYTDPKTTMLGGCGVTLRTYNGQLVGPTLRVKPGDVMNILLDNQLPIESPDESAAQIKQEADNAFINTRPHSFNTTNLHTHGLHVSPVGNSDNVLLAIPPQTRLPYEIKLPANHPSGAFWYHAHAHGSTAIQVGSGMAGALIIEDDPAKIPAALREANKHEKVMVFETILYDAQGKAQDITSFFPDSPPPAPQPTPCQQNLPSCTWNGSLRRTTINGQIVPIIKMQPGEVQRWRMIDAAFRESLFLQIRKQGSTTEGIAFNEIALDGIYLSKIDTWLPNQPIDLEPGYRSDALVQAPLARGRYELIDASSLTTKLGVGLRGTAEPEDVIAYIDIDGPRLDMKLPTSDEIGKLNPFPGVKLYETADGVQEAIFKLGSAVDSNTDGRNYFQVNYAAFNPTHVRYLKLGATDMWNLETIGDPPGIQPPGNAIPPLPHVFHIHVNPFQMQRQDPSGNQEWVWKDTLLIPPGTPTNLNQIQIYTQYLDYIGQFVIHCHILDHEDLGMMEVVEVVGEQPATSLPTHGGH
jgi:FtsP/CotA-like multicopper oxidase with cupredoxin domain